MIDPKHDLPIRKQAKALAIKVGRRHARTLMRKLGIEAIYHRPNTSKPVPGHRIYPYLLRRLAITAPTRHGP